MVSSINFYPFGACRNSPPYPTDKLFTGQRLDSTGLYYYGARYYDPTIGRFISPDSIVQRSGNPQSLNRYSYVLNNPLKSVDPTGHDDEMEDLYNYMMLTGQLGSSDNNGVDEGPEAQSFPFSQTITAYEPAPSVELVTEIASLPIVGTILTLASVATNIVPPPPVVVASSLVSGSITVDRTSDWTTVSVDMSTTIIGGQGISPTGVTFTGSLPPLPPTAFDMLLNNCTPASGAAPINLPPQVTIGPVNPGGGISIPLQQVAFATEGTNRYVGSISMSTNTQPLNVDLSFSYQGLFGDTNLVWFKPSNDIPVSIH